MHKHPYLNAATGVFSQFHSEPNKLLSVGFCVIQQLNALEFFGSGHKQQGDLESFLTLI